MTAIFLKRSPTSERRMARGLFAALGTAALICVALPASGALFGDETARKQIADQTRRIDALKQQNDELAGRLARIEESLKTLSASNPGMELIQHLELVRKELKEMRGQLEVMGNDIQVANKRQKDMYVDLDSRVKRIEQPAAAGAAPGAAAGAPPAAAGAPAPGATAAPGQVASPAETNAYETAQGQRRIGNYQGAIVAFQSFLTQYPKSQLAPRAQY